MSPVEAHRNDAEYVIAGDEITMARISPSLQVRKVLGEADGWVAIGDHWQETVPERVSPMCLTLVHSPLQGGRYGVIVWYLDEPIGEALKALNIRQNLAVTVYGVGMMDASVKTREQARACCLELARRVAHAELPWPPEDDQDVEVWRAMSAIVGVAPQAV